MGKMRITAAILANGKNSRIDIEKSLLQINGITIIDKTVTLLSSIFAELIIITEKEILRNKFPHIKSVGDYYKNIGPIAGIHSSLTNAAYDDVFVFACDMPYLNPVLLNNMISYYKTECQDKYLLVPCHSRGNEPLHAIYSKKCLPIIEQQLTRNIYKISAFFEAVPIAKYDVSEEYLPSFDNINTKEDWQRIV